MAGGGKQHRKEVADYPTYFDGPSTPLGQIVRVGPSFLHEPDGVAPLFFATVHVTGVEHV